MEIRELKDNEDLYIYRNSMQISQQTGFIGCLRGIFQRDEPEWFSLSWRNFRKDRKTDDFKNERDNIINALRDEGGFLADPSSMKDYCEGRKKVRNPYGETISYGVRIDTEKYAYLVRIVPEDNEFFCWCYIKEFLDSHIRNAAKGIRFIDSCYNDKFIVPDGGKIKLVYRDGREVEKMCRYIDPTHIELWDEIYHICELAERTEENGITIELVDPM